jgi:hypothetical protein
MGKHYCGGKFSGSHSTAIEASHKLLRAAEANPLVSKIALGIITSVASGNQELRITQISAGLELKVRGTCYVQEIYIYTAQPDRVKIQLEEIWLAKGKQKNEPQPWNPKMKDGWNRKPWSKWNKKNGKKNR